MKTKTITKTFYVSDGCFELLNKNKVILTISDFKDDERSNEIQVSWQEPERKIEITESEFEKAWDESLINHSMRTEIRFSKEFYNFKQKLFGASDE